MREPVQLQCCQATVGEAGLKVGATRRSFSESGYRNCSHAGRPILPSPISKLVAAAGAEPGGVRLLEYIPAHLQYRMWCCPRRSRKVPRWCRLVTSFEETSRTYADRPSPNRSTRGISGPSGGRRQGVDAELTYLIPAQSVVTEGISGKFNGYAGLPGQREGRYLSIRSSIIRLRKGGRHRQ
jgi:hypothetical protein